MFGRRVTIFLVSLWGGPFFLKMTLRGGLRIFELISILQVFTSSFHTHNSLYLSQLYPFYVITHVNMEPCFTKSLYKEYLFSKTHNN